MIGQKEQLCGQRVEIKCTREKPVYDFTKTHKKRRKEYRTILERYGRLRILNMLAL